MKWEEFKKKMDKADTLGDADKLIRKLTKEQKKDLIKTYKKMKEMSGLTMRDVYVLSSTETELKIQKLKE